MRTLTKNELLQTIDQQKYHKASTFYLYCHRFVEENEKNGRRFRTPTQGFEAASLKWNMTTEEEKQQFRNLLKMERKVVGGDRLFKIRNGSRRDGDYDPVTYGMLKDIELRYRKYVDNLIQRWTWKYDSKSDLGLERFIIVNVDVPLTASNPGAFSSLAMVEFSLSEGVIQEYSVVIDGRFQDVDRTRYGAISRVLNLPAKNGRSFGEPTPAFFVPPGKLEAVFNALIYVGKNEKSTNWNDSEKRFGLVLDIAEVNVLDRALSKWLKQAALEKEGIGEEECLDRTRAWVKRILDRFGFKW